jgi:hypothetical protein
LGVWIDLVSVHVHGCAPFPGQTSPALREPPAPWQVQSGCDLVFHLTEPLRSPKQLAGRIEHTEPEAALKCDKIRYPVAHRAFVIVPEPGTLPRSGLECQPVAKMNSRKLNSLTGEKAGEIVRHN